MCIPTQIQLNTVKMVKIGPESAVLTIRSAMRVSMPPNSVRPLVHPKFWVVWSAEKPASIGP